MRHALAQVSSSAKKRVATHHPERSWFLEGTHAKNCALARGLCRALGNTGAGVAFGVAGEEEERTGEAPAIRGKPSNSTGPCSCVPALTFDRLGWPGWVAQVRSGRFSNARYRISTARAKVRLLLLTNVHPSSPLVRQRDVRKFRPSSSIPVKHPVSAQ